MPSRNPPSASTMEKAEELLRQAVKNSTNVENSAAKLPTEESDPKDTNDSRSNERLTPENENVSTQINDTAASDRDAANDLPTTSTKSDNCASNIDKSASLDVENSSSTKDISVDTTNPDSDLSPEKRGIKRLVTCILQFKDMNLFLFHYSNCNNLILIKLHTSASR